MKYVETPIKGLLVIEPKVFTDSRGYFMEAWKQEEFEAHVGNINFVQENESGSSLGVLRGLHYQLAPFSQAKLVRVIEGAVWDVAVDLRKGSPTFGQYYGVELSGENRLQYFIPRGFAHGFQVLSEKAIFTYKVDNPYMPAAERSIRFDDPDINVAWRGEEECFVLSDKDKNGSLLKDAEINFTI